MLKGLMAFLTTILVLTIFALPTAKAGVQPYGGMSDPAAQELDTIDEPRDLEQQQTDELLTEEEREQAAEDQQQQQQQQLEEMETFPSSPYE